MDPMSSRVGAGLMGEGGHRAVTESSLSGQPNTIVLVLDSLGPPDVAALIAQVVPGTRADHPNVILCDLAQLAQADMGTVDALARLALGARRLGCSVSLRNPPSELCELLAFAGLGDVLPRSPGSGVEVVGESEQREEPLGVEEEGDPADPPLA
jgi:ABC-type transporter Mla MlaB component